MPSHGNNGYGNAPGCYTYINCLSCLCLWRSSFIYYIYIYIYLFNVLLTVHLSIILVINQVNAQNLSFTISLLYASRCFDHCCAHHQEVKLYYTASGIVTLCRWPSGAQVERGVLFQPVQWTATYNCDDTRCCLIQFDLLMMSTYCSKHVKEYNKLIIKKEFMY